MNARIFCLSLILFVGIPTYALAQASQNSGGQNLFKNMRTLTPATQARMDKSFQLAQEAAVALDAGQYATAEYEARVSISLKFGAGMAEEVLAQALTDEGKSQEAFQEYQKMANWGNVYPRVLLPYALMLLQRGQWVQALDAYDRALPHVGEIGLIHADRVLAAESHFSPDKPEPKALETVIHIALGNIYDSEGTFARHSQSDKAFREYQDAKLLEPNSPAASLAYAQALWEHGRKKDAIKEFQTVVTYGGEAGASAVDALKDHRLGPDDQQ